MMLCEQDKKILDTLEDYYLSCQVRPPEAVADFSSDRQTGTALHPNEKVTLPLTTGPSTQG